MGNTRSSWTKILSKFIYLIFPTWIYEIKKKSLYGSSSLIFSLNINLFSFRFLVSQKSFVPYVGVFFDRRFVDENPTIYTDRDLSTTLTLVNQDPAYLPYLEVIYIQNSRT